jgi:serine/threonine protein kinase/Flp pilus assembly protein TadD
MRDSSHALGQLRVALGGRYRLERALGAGGMATVYLAHDLKHDRPVALKVLRPELAASLGPERFLAEIRTTARLQHPHIVALFDSGEADGFLYYVMPLIEGESLRAHLDREQRLDVDAMLAIARPVAQALAYAHDRGVVHRDVKPENILLSGGQPFVTDFGIARAVSVAGGERLTATGIAVGTPAYMSPEQALGDEVVDGRSDVYSLGCVIYEMLSGGPPFTGASVQALLARRLTGPPPHLTGVPAPVDEVVRRSLATAPQDRFATAQALADALVEAARKPAAEELSIVVLPFENLSPDPDNAFFADGLTEELIADLSKVRALRVISRTSAMHYRGTTKPLPEITRELNVRYVLEGSVRRAANSLRITAQLIDAARDVHLWAEKYAGTLEDVFDIQERVSREIVGALSVALTSGEDRRLGARPIRNVHAYEAWLRARREAYSLNEPGLDRARQLLENALAVVGDNALLLAGLGYVYVGYFHGGAKPDEETLRKAEEYAIRALRIDEGSSLAHAVLAAVTVARGQMKQGIRHARRALDIDPNDPDALVWIGFTTVALGKTSFSQPFAARLLAIDPLLPSAHIVAGMQHWFEGRFDLALPSFRTAARLGPDNPIALYWLLLGLAANRLFDEADAVLRASLAQQAGLEFMTSSLAFFLMACRGEKQAALSSVSESWTAPAWQDYALPQMIADAYAALGETEEALRWLERTVEWGWINYPWFAVFDPWLENLHGDVRFQRLMERVKKEWEEFEV